MRILCDRSTRSFRSVCASRRGSAVYHAGDPFSALYAIRVGSCKSTILGEKGYEQVAGYHVIGDIIGLDGIAMACTRATPSLWKTATCACCRSAVWKSSPNET